MGSSEFRDLMQIVKIAKLAKEQEPEESEPEPIPEPLELDPSIENDLEVDDNDEPWMLPGAIKKRNCNQFSKTG